MPTWIDVAKNKGEKERLQIEKEKAEQGSTFRQKTELAREKITQVLHTASEQGLIVSDPRETWVSLCSSTLNYRRDQVPYHWRTGGYYMIQKNDPPRVSFDIYADWIGPAYDHEQHGVQLPEIPLFAIVWTVVEESTVNKILIVLTAESTGLADYLEKDLQEWLIFKFSPTSQGSFTKKR